MGEFRDLWFDSNISSWTPRLAHLAGQPDLNFVELGCWEGRATCWMLGNILTHPSSRIIVIDTFKGGVEQNVPDPDAVYNRFMHNIEPWRERVEVLRMPTHEGLGRLQQRGATPFAQFGYVDAAHDAESVERDGTMLWPLIAPGGIVAFDDAHWTYALPNGKLIGPERGIEAFLDNHAGSYELIAKDHQCWVRRTH